MFVPHALRSSTKRSPSSAATTHCVSTSGEISSAKPESVHIARPPSGRLPATARRPPSGSRRRGRRRTGRCTEVRRVVDETVSRSGARSSFSVRLAWTVGAGFSADNELPLVAPDAVGASRARPPPGSAGACGNVRSPARARYRLPPVATGRRGPPSGSGSVARRGRARRDGTPPTGLPGAPRRAAARSRPRAAPRRAPRRERGHRGGGPAGRRGRAAAARSRPSPPAPPSRPQPARRPWPCGRPGPVQGRSRPARWRCASPWAPVRRGAGAAAGAGAGAGAAESEPGGLAPGPRRTVGRVEDGVGRGFTEPLDGAPR